MKYSKAQVIYHWLSFAVLIVMALSGLAFTYDWIDSGSIRLHQILGQLFILILGVRLVTRLMRPVEHGTAHHKSFETIAAQVVHGALYLCMIAYVITGYIAASGLRDPLLVAPINQAFARSDTGEWFLEAHFTLKWVLLALFAVHVAAVLKHQYWDKDTPLTNMTLTFRKD